MGLGNLLLIPGLGAAPLDIRAKVGVSSSPTVTGSQAIAGVGFQPKAVLPFGALCAASGVYSGGLLGLGAATSTSSEAAISASSQNGQTTTNTARRHTASASVSLLASTGVLFNEADIASIGVSGFTLNWSTVDAVSYLLNHICLGGADLEVSLTQHQMNGTNAPQSFAHGLSGSPTAVLFFTGNNTLAPPNTSSVAAFGLGLWSPRSQHLLSIEGRHGLTTSLTARFLSNNSVSGFIGGGGPITVQRSMSVSAVSSSDVSVTYPVTVSNAQIHFFMLAIRGAKCQTGTFKYGTLSPLTINCTGITPRLFLPIFVPDGVDTINAVINNIQLTIGASDGTANCSSGFHDMNGLTTTNTQRWQSSTTLSERSSSGVLTSEATAAFSGQSVVVTPTTLTNSGYGQGAYLIIGA